MNTALMIGAAIVSVLLFFGLLGILKTTFKTALLIAIVIFVLQYFTRIGPQQVFDQVLKFIGGIGNWLQRSGSNYKTKESLLWLLDLVASAIVSG